MGAPPAIQGLLEISNERSVKRKAVEDRDVAEGRRTSRRRTRDPENGSRVSQNESGGESDNYDPDQDLQERRKLRAKLRNLEKDLNNNRTEFLLADNEGLKQTLLDADVIIDGVKQTSDATIDSRLFVNAADLSLKKVEKLTLGDTERRVDIDHFVAKCMTFMRRGQSSAPASYRAAGSTQARHNRSTQHADNSDDEDPEAGDMLNWSYLGAFACLQHNSRPPVPGFLLGPLSLEKRMRKVLQRRARNANKDLVETRPEILRPEDIEKSENSSLTVLCARIMERLRRAAEEEMDACDAEAWEDITEEETKALMRRHGVNEDGGVDLFKFVINPRSFGQTVENLFYVSFLIRDGKAAITIDDDGLPYLCKSHFSPSYTQVTMMG
jgi:non-structural maintenance of chromosomes element 4